MHTIEQNQLIVHDFIVRMWYNEIQTPEGRATMKAIHVILMTVVMAGAVGAVDISIDTTLKYQTVEGMGAFAVIKPWKVRKGAFYVDIDLDSIGYYDSLISELGATMFRTMVAHEYNPAQDVWDASTMSGDYGQFYTMRKLREAADRQDEPLSFITHVWSPPGWMKVSGLAEGGMEASPNYSVTDCRLLDGMDDEFAHFMAEYVSVVKDSTGIDYYAVSIQDEPAFQEPYASCVYSPLRYTSVFKVVADTFRTRGMAHHFFGAEHMMWAFPSVFESAVRSDPAALEQMHAWAIHGYQDGVRADTGSWGGATATDKPLWMSSTSGWAYGTNVNDWPGAMALGRNILLFLRESKGSVWTWWSTMESCVAGCEQNDSVGGYALLVNGSPTAKYYVSSQFYRYVRPGARQIASESSDPDVRVVAFRHAGNDCLTLVLVNSATEVRTLTGITGPGVAQSFEMVTSTEAAKLQRSVVSATDAIDLPASSVTTLVAGTYRSTGTAAAHRDGPPAMHALPGAAKSRVPGIAYTLDGRRVALTAARSSPGVFVGAAMGRTGPRSCARVVIAGRR